MSPAFEHLLFYGNTRRLTEEELKKIVEIQLTHSGRYSVPRPIIAQHDPLLAQILVVSRHTGISEEHGAVANVVARTLSRATDFCNARKVHSM